MNKCLNIIENGCVENLSSIKDIIEYKKKLQQKIFNMKIELKDGEKNLKEIKSFLRIYCNHCWKVDYIDSMKGYKEGVSIKYCEKCELNFNTD